MDILARHRDSGVVEMATDSDHSYAAGYPGSRGIRTWQERMRLLEDLGFIKSRKVGNQKYKFVMLVHPTIVVQNLRNKGKIDDAWWDTYRARQIEAKEPSYEELMAWHQSDKTAPPVPAPPAPVVVPITTAKAKDPAKGAA